MLQGSMYNVGELPGVASSFLLHGARAAAMQPVLALASRAARSAANVLITGESGTGKRSLAQWIHQNGPRCAGPLVRGGAGISEVLVRDARTSANHGGFAGAVGGTLVIDELCELSPEAQAALVHMLDLPTLRASGASGTRVIATTQYAIDHAIRAGTLRVDLYYVLGVISIAVPPLRKRFEDIPVLVAAFLARASQRPVKITSAALAWLAGADWPGNVRELESTIERAVALSDGGVIDVVDVSGLEGAARAAVTSPGHRGHRSSRR